MFCLKYGLTKRAKVDLLALIRLIDPHILPPSLFILEKANLAGQDNITRTVKTFCKAGHLVLNVQDGVCDHVDISGAMCGIQVNAEEDDCLIMLDIADTLRVLLKDKKLETFSGVAAAASFNGMYSCTHHGKLYRDLVQENVVREGDLSGK